MSEATYRDVVKRIGQIRQLCSKRSKGSNQPDPVTQLVEIESHINRVRNFLDLAKKVDAINDEDTVKGIMRVLAKQEKEKNRIEKINADARRNADTQAKLQERKNNKKVVTGIKVQFKRSKKPMKEKREVKKDELTTEEKDILKYLEMNFEGEQTKKKS